MQDPEGTGGDLTGSLTRKPQRSLKRLLTGWLVWPLAALILASTAPAYFLALGSANHAYDSALLDPALAIATHVRQTESSIAVDLSDQALDVLRIDAQDRVFVQVRGPKGELIAGTAALPDAPKLPPDGRLFFNASVDGERVRIVALSIAHPLGQTIVQVAETYGKRDLMVQEMLIGAIVSELFVALAAVALLWYGVGRGLAPLEALRDEIAARSPKDLRDVTEGDKPTEVAPIVTALNGLLGQLKSAIDRQQRFISNAAHQLRTPLSGLKMHAELARRQPSSAEMRSLLDMIAGETDRTVRLVNQLLTLARAEPDMAALPASTPINLHDIGSRAVQEWLPRALAKNIDLGFELEDAWVSGDGLLMRELLANLIDNALAYTPPGGRVTVRTHEDDANALIEVEDNGRGIPRPERERVFERFYRAQGTPGEGSGLGLAIVSEIANRHAGAIEIISPTTGEGALLRATFPKLLRANPFTAGENSALRVSAAAPNSR